MNWPAYIPSADTGTGKHVGAGVTRLIPANTNTIIVTVTDGSPSQTFTLTRSNPSSISTAAFTLPLGSFPVNVKEYADVAANVTPASVVLAEANGMITVTAGNSDAAHAAGLSISPDSAITHIKAVLSGPNAAKPKLLTNDTVTVVGTAYDAQEAVVPVPVGAITYAVTASTSVVRVDAITGVATAQQYGTAALKAIVTLHRDSPSTDLVIDSDPAMGTKYNATVSVDVQVSISPPLMTLVVQPRPATAPGGALLNTQQFTATVPGGTVPGDGSGQVTWSITKTDGTPVTDGSGGSITATGFYTAPVNRGLGVYLVRATSKDNPSQFANANVTIYSGSVQVNVN